MIQMIGALREDEGLEMTQRHVFHNFLRVSLVSGYAEATSPTSG